MFTLFARVCVRKCVRATASPSLSLSLSLSPPQLRLDVHSRTCMREFRNEHRIYGLARLDSIPFASSPVIPLDFVRLRPASLSDARLLPDRVFLNNSSAPLLAGARLGTDRRLRDPGAFAGFIPRQPLPPSRLHPFPRARLRNVVVFKIYLPSERTDGDVTYR